MKDNQAIHMTEELPDIESNFKIHPFTEGTGCPISDVDEPHLHDFYRLGY